MATSSTFQKRVTDEEQDDWISKIQVDPNFKPAWETATAEQIIKDILYWKKRAEDGTWTA